MAAQRPQQSPLNILTSMFHAVLCQTADVFNSPERRHIRAIRYTNAQVTMTVIPALHDRFHFGLDVLEMDIVSAKTALRRHLDLIQAERRAREEAEAAEHRKQEEEEAQEARQQEEGEARRQEEEEARKVAAEAEARNKVEEMEEAERTRRKREEKARKALPIVIEDSNAPPPPPPPPPPSAGRAGSVGNFDFWMDVVPPHPTTTSRFSMGNGATIQNQPSGIETGGNTNSLEDFLASIPVPGAPPADGIDSSANGEQKPQGISSGDMSVMDGDMNGGGMGGRNDMMSDYNDFFNF